MLTRRNEKDRLPLEATLAAQEAGSEETTVEPPPEYEEDQITEVIGIHIFAMSIRLKVEQVLRVAAVEYVLIIAGIAVVLIGAIGLFGDALVAQIQSLTGALFNS